MTLKPEHDLYLRKISGTIPRLDGSYPTIFDHDSKETYEGNQCSAILVNGIGVPQEQKWNMSHDKFIIDKDGFIQKNTKHDYDEDESDLDECGECGETLAPNQKECLNCNTSTSKPSDVDDEDEKDDDDNEVEAEPKKGILAFC